MKQLLLDLDSQILPSLTTFVVGQNAELAQLLGLFAQRTPSLYGERSVYIWGETGAGKTHLLHALADHPHSRYIPATAPEPAFEFSPDISLYLVDDCDQLNRLNQIIPPRKPPRLPPGKGRSMATRGGLGVGGEG